MMELGILGVWSDGLHDILSQCHVLRQGIGLPDLQSFITKTVRKILHDFEIKKSIIFGPFRPSLLKLS